MPRYRIVQDIVWQCRLLAVEPKRNCVVLKFCKYDTGEYLFSVVRDSFDLKPFYDDFRRQNIHTIHRVAIESTNGVYHKYTWDDVYKGITTNSHVGEIQRDENNVPIKWKTVVEFGDIDGFKDPSAINQFLKNNIDVDSPNVQEALNYNNRQSYLDSLSKAEYEREREEREAYNCMMQAAYEAHEQRMFDQMNMTEEDRVMDALENGEGELYGY